MSLVLLQNFNLQIVPSDNNSFHLSDATSLLMRLELEDFRPVGVSLKDRWREVALLYADQVEASDAMLFYDFHTLLACLYGDQVNS